MGKARLSSFAALNRRQIMLFKETGYLSTGMQANPFNYRNVPE